MLLYLLAFAGGILTIISPCILPVLPFVFSRADQPFRRSGLPLLAGMVLTFALVATAATVAGAWVVRANQIGRGLAIVMFTVLGLALLFPRVAEYLARPFVRLGGRVQVKENELPGVGKSLLLGVSTGLLWAPCAGPILGLILTGAAISGASARTALLLVAFALGAGCSLALALLAGAKVFALMKRSLGTEEWIRRGLGVAVLVGVVAIASGWDTGVLRRLSLAGTSGIEQRLVDRVQPVKLVSTGDSTLAQRVQAANEGSLPSLEGAVAWLNSPPLTSEGLRGKVVLIDFWTYSCINCLRAIPYVQAWAEKYRDDGLVVIGVHTPEFAFERDHDNVANAVRTLAITYPVAIDNTYAIWKLFHNMYWPAHYFVDVNGTIRYHHFGEGKYDQSEQVIQLLLMERNASLKARGLVDVRSSGAQAPAALGDVRSPETYIGFGRQKHLVSPEPVKQNAAGLYTAPGQLGLNDWALAGNWEVGRERALLVTRAGQDRVSIPRPRPAPGVGTRKGRPADPVSGPGGRQSAAR